MPILITVGMFAFVIAATKLEDIRTVDDFLIFAISGIVFLICAFIAFVRLVALATAKDVSSAAKGLGADQQTADELGMVVGNVTGRIAGGVVLGEIASNLNTSVSECIKPRY